MLNAEEKVKVRRNQNEAEHVHVHVRSNLSKPQYFTFCLSQLLLPLMMGLVWGRARRQRLRHKSIQKRQRGIHLDDNVINNKV